jgi:branched-chain amino acid transport system substrate-binding protein
VTHAATAEAARIKEKEETMASKYFFAAIAALTLTAVGPVLAQKNYAPGVTDSEIKIGQTMPYSGPASAWGTVGLAELAYFRMINEQGGVNGRKIKLISLDDAFSAPKTVEQTRKLVEEERVAAVFGSIGGATNLAVRKYLNDNRIPQLFALNPSVKFNDPQHFPWTIGIQPTLYLEGQIHARYILAHKPSAKIAVLHATDPVAKEGVDGFKSALGEKAPHLIVKEQSYEESDPTVYSQIVALKASGADTFYDISSPKFATQSIRKASELGWKPLHFLFYGSQSISTVLEPAGVENSIGVISATFGKDPADPQWKDDQNTRDYLDWLQKYYPGGKATDIYIAAGYSFPQPLIYVLKQCGDDLSRENIMRQATNLHNVSMPWLLPGVTLDTSPTDYQPIKKLREMRFNGKTWELLKEEN